MAAKSESSVQPDDAGYARMKCERFPEWNVDILAAKSRLPPTKKGARKAPSILIF